VLPATVEVRGPLAEEGAVRGTTLLCGPQSLETLLDDGRVLPVVVGVHLDVRGADVHLVAGTLQTDVTKLSVYFIKVRREDTYVLLCREQ
jgi:hypothetical protein